MTGLTELRCEDPGQVLAAIDAGNEIRAQGVTSANERSSRCVHAMGFRTGKTVVLLLLLLLSPSSSVSSFSLVHMHILTVTCVRASGRMVCSNLFCGLLEDIRTNSSENSLWLVNRAWWGEALTCMFFF